MKICGEFTIAEPLECKKLTRKEKRALERVKRKEAYKELKKRETLNTTKTKQ